LATPTWGACNAALSTFKIPFTPSTGIVIIEGGFFKLGETQRVSGV